MELKIDKVATKKALKSDGHTLKGFARDNGINDDSFKAWFRGWFSENSATHKLIVQVLGEKGYLRYEDPLYAVNWY